MTQGPYDRGTTALAAQDDAATAPQVQPRNDGLGSLPSTAAAGESTVAQAPAEVLAADSRALPSTTPTTAIPPAPGTGVGSSSTPRSAGATTGGAPSVGAAQGAAAGGGPVGVPGNWAQVFGDEFTGSVIDTTRWRLNRSGGVGLDGAFNPSSEGAFFSPANVTAQDGAAVLSIRPEVRLLAGTSYTHSSGRCPAGGFALSDGDYVEARLFILDGPSNAWPLETDIFESFNSASQSRPAFNYHAAGGGQSGPKAYGEPGVDYRNSWHTYGMLRSGGTMVPCLDGDAYPKAGASSGVDVMKQFIIFNLSMYDGPVRPPIRRCASTRAGPAAGLNRAA